MTPIAKMVRAMIEKGIDIDIIELAVSTAEQTASGGNQVDKSAEKRRAWDREYRRNKRENPPDSTRHPPDSENTLLLKEDKKEDNQESKKERATANRGTRMSADWQPDPDDWTATVGLIGSARAQSELLKFRDYWIALPGSKGLKLDWPATWRNWIRRISENTGATNGNRNSQNRTSGFAGSAPTSDDAVVTGMARALERRRAARAPDDPGRQEFRERGGDGGAGRDAAESGASQGDGGSHRQLALLPVADRRT